MSFKQLINPHAHSDGSLDGAASVIDIVEVNHKLGATHVTLTEHGNLNTAMDLYNACNKKFKGSIKPILGIELYLEPPFVEKLRQEYWPFFKDKKGGEQKLEKKLRESYVHLTVHFKDEWAWSYFCRLTPAMEKRAIVKWGESKPICTVDELQGAAGHITICSSCFVPGTKVKTLNGLKTIESIQCGERVFNRYGEIDTVLTPTQRFYEGLVYKIRIQGCPDPFVCTPDHKFLVLNGFNQYEWIEAKDLIRNQKVSMVNASHVSHDRYITYNYNGKKSGSVTFDLYDPETLWVIGLFLAEGSWGSERCGRRDSFQVTLHKNETEYANRFARWAERMGGATAIAPAKKSRAVRVQVCGVVLTNAWISLMEGHATALTKKIPSLIKGLPLDCLRHVVRGYLDGDGCYQFSRVNHKKTGTYESIKVTAASVSFDLIDDLSDIYRRAGIHYTVSKKSYFVDRHGTQHKDSYYLSVSSYCRVWDLWNWIEGNVSIERGSGNGLSKVTKIETEWYSGMVHCLSIESDPSFALAGGPIVHNCMVGAIQKWLIPDRITGKIYTEEAERSYHMMRDIAGKDNFFVEIFPHQITHNWKKAVKDKNGRVIEAGDFVPHECNQHIIDGDLQKFPNQFVWSLAKKNNDRCIISLDSHFAYPEQKVIQDAKLGNGQESWKFFNSYHVYSSDQAAQILKHQMGVSDRDIEEWIDNSYQWASLFDGFKLTTSEDRWVIPSLPEDWKKQTRERIDRYGRMNWNDPEMVSRLQKELKLFANNGKINLMPYFFTVEDVARFCRENDILMNVRGSAGGVLLLYLFNVCAFNPLLHDLSLDRFLTYGRIDSNTLPDVDMDVSDKDKVIKYLEDTYQDGFCKISTDMMLKLKSSIKDAERYIKGSVSIETEKLCKKLPMSPQGSHEYEFVFGSTDKDGSHTPGVIDYDKDLQKWVEKNPNTWKIVEQMLGVQRQKSVHACGCVIADEPIQNYCPIIFIKGNKATGFNPKSVEDIGLIKFDFLGVNTLKDIELCVQSIKDRLGREIDPWTLPSDEKVMAMFHKGDTATIFQFDSQTVVPYLKKIKPRDIEELAQVTALCRPGTLDALDEDGKRTLAEVYVARRQGEPVKYVHPDMESIIGDTMGIALFQEQTLKIFKVLAGYSDEKTEVARRGIGKKQKEVLESCMADLRQGCYKRGWSEQQVDLLIDQIMASARYSFNKSHSISYAYVAYACAWLRFHYPLDWWKAVLSNSDKDEIVTKWWPFVKDLVVEPNVNTPADSFVIDGDKLITPLSFLKGVGDKAFTQLIQQAPYKNIQDFCIKHFRKRSKEEDRSSVHSGVAHKLIISGSLDSLFRNEEELKGTTQSLAKKLEFFEKQKAKVRNKRKPDPVDPIYTELSSTGLYLVKKQVLPTYSVDLRPLVLIGKGGYPDEKHPVWVLGSDRVFDGIAIRRLRELAEIKKGYWLKAVAVAYVVDESIISYQNNSKQATKLFVDINGEFSETILWPKFDDEIGMAPKGFKDKIVLLTYQSKPDRFSLIDVELAIKA